MILSPLPLDSGGLGVGLERGSAGMGAWGAWQGGRRGSWEGTGGLPFGLTGGVPFCARVPPPLQPWLKVLLPDFGASLVSSSSTPRSFFSELCSHCRSPRECERFQGAVGVGGPSRSSQLRLAGMGERLCALRSPSRLKPFREGLVKKLFGNLRWFLPFCCRASVERVMGRVG